MQVERQTLAVAMAPARSFRRGPNGDVARCGLDVSSPQHEVARARVLGGRREREVAIARSSRTRPMHEVARRGGIGQAPTHEVARAGGSACGRGTRRRGDVARSGPDPFGQVPPEWKNPAMKRE